ncbi:WD40 repeat-like protein, partial [Pluteus cervinus]
LKFNMCNLNTSYIKNSQIEDLHQIISLYISPELQYSAQYWAYHLVKISNFNEMNYNQTLPKLLVTFTTIYWIECLSLLGKLRFGLRCIQQLQAWFKITTIYVHDLCNFMTKFYTPILESTPHIYLSALPFSPRHSIIFQKCSAMIQNRVKIVKNSLSWNVTNMTIAADDTTCIVFQPQNDTLYLGSDEGSIKANGHAITIWDLSTGQQLCQPLSYHTSEISSMIIAPKEQYLISGSHDATVIVVEVWNIQAAQCIFGPFVCHTSPIRAISVSPDSRQIITSGEDGTIRTWNTQAML